MKVIDLLNRIANGLDVPKKIKYSDKIYELNDEQNAYYMNVEEDDEENYGRNFWSGYNFNILNEQVEIIEENKKIEHIGKSYNIRKFDDNFNVNGYDFEEMIKFIQDIYNKVEDIVDKINGMENK